MNNHKSRKVQSEVDILKETIVKHGLTIIAVKKDIASIIDVVTKQSQLLDLIFKAIMHASTETKKTTSGENDPKIDNPDA